jgi:putative membrane protein insertion efficiency factor
MSLGRRLTLGFAVAAALLTLDLSREPQRQVTAGLLIGAIHLYQATLSPWSSAIGARCRFVPSCSRYAERVISRFGAWRGVGLTVRRLARCGPWTPMGTVDPPPGGP